MSSDPVFTDFVYGVKNGNIYSYQYKNAPLAECVNCPQCPGKYVCDKTVCCQKIDNASQN